MLKLLWFTNQGREVRKEREDWDRAIYAYRNARCTTGANFGRWSEDGGETWHYF